MSVNISYSHVNTEFTQWERSSEFLPPSPHRGLDLSIVSNTLVTGTALDPGTTPLVAISSLPSLPAASTALRVTFNGSIYFMFS